MIRMGSIVALCVLLMSLASERAGSYTTDSDEYHAVLNPLGALRAYNDAMLTGRPTELMARSYACTEEGQQVREATCQNDASVGKVLAAARKLFNPAAAEQIGHALGDQNNTDIGNAKFIIDGDHASVFPMVGGTPTAMIRDVDGRWKLDIEARVESPPNPAMAELACFEMEMKSDLAEKLAAAILAKQVKSPDEAMVFITQQEQQQAQENEQEQIQIQMQELNNNLPDVPDGVLLIDPQ